MRYLIILAFIAGSAEFSFGQQFQIHDVNSIDPNSKPLIVLDEKVLPDQVKSKLDSTKWVYPLTEIVPEDIDQIEILKNQTAVALYGERAKNGVIIITTKQHVMKLKKE